MKSSILPLSLSLLGLSLSAHASNFPVTVSSCERSITFDKAPTRAIIHDQNMSQMAFALDLQDNIVGLTGITGWYKTSPLFDEQRQGIPELASKNPSLENIISVNPDLFFAGWNYGMRIGEDVTPQGLARFNINTLELSESCVHLGNQADDANMALLYNDMIRLGAVFGVKEKAEQLVQTWQQELDEIQLAVADKKPVKVFLYDSGEDKVFTSGRFGMPTALIRAAGGINVMDHLDTSWGKVSIESIMDTNPDFIILVDYDKGGWKQSWDFLQNHPLLSQLNAVKNKRFLALEYGEITPGPLNIDAIKKLSQRLFEE
ncbi:ABC transporter substrate-binding protein [Marinomonas sp. 42_23_T18]|nr:ABC transporter substrate-binding protein [Marinomonas sp. 42_23_T18]